MRKIIWYWELFRGDILAAGFGLIVGLVFVAALNLLGVV